MRKRDGSDRSARVKYMQNTGRVRLRVTYNRETCTLLPSSPDLLQEEGDELRSIRRSMFSKVLHLSHGSRTCETARCSRRSKMLPTWRLPEKSEFILMGGQQGQPCVLGGRRERAQD